MHITIIMPSFNQVEYLPAAVGSVLQQAGGFELELWIMDGGSTDGTVEYLSSIDDPRVRWVSAPDGGQAAAINTGMALASGDIAAWLNSDDLYEPGALAAVVEAFAQHPDAPWLVGDCRIVDERARTIREGVTRYKRRRLRRYSYRSLLRENIISQMSVFWRRDFGQRLAAARGGELLDASLHYCMDYDLWLRMGAEAQPMILDRTLAAFRVHDTSKTHMDHRAQFAEQRRVMRRYAPGSPLLRLQHELNILKARAGYRVLGWLGR